MPREIPEGLKGPSEGRHAEKQICPCDLDFKAFGIDDHGRSHFVSIYVGLYVLYKCHLDAQRHHVKDFLSCMRDLMAFLNLTDAHMRGARGLLNWNQQRLADESGLAASTIKRLENGGIAKASVENIEKISSALERAGIDFFHEGGPGVQLKDHGVGAQPAKTPG